MAYSDYGAFVYQNGKRRKDKEDTPIFSKDENNLQQDDNSSSKDRFWFPLLDMKHERMSSLVMMVHHGVLGDGNIRVACYKQGLPRIFEAKLKGFKEIEYREPDVDFFEYDEVDYSYKGYKFLFRSGTPYEAEMIEPDGTVWRCEYDYSFGAGFEE